MAKQTDRHSKLLRQIVLGDGHASLQSLSESLGVCIRTIRRDLAALRKLGIPIEERIDLSRKKTYWLSQAQLPQIRFLYDEAFALMLYRSATTTFEGTTIGQAADNAFEKILVALGSREKSYLKRMLPRFHDSGVGIGGDYTSHSEIIDALTIAIDESRTTFLTYHPLRSTEPVTYDINPYGMIEHRGTLYVVGYSCHRDEVRMWKVDRILSAEVTEVHFSRPSDFNLRQHVDGAFAVVSGDKRIAVRVKFSGSAARYIQEKRMHPSQQVTVCSDGSAEATFELTSTLEIKSWILSFGKHAEVLEPPTLRQEVQTELSQALKIYDSDPNTIVGVQPLGANERAKR